MLTGLLVQRKELFEFLSKFGRSEIAEDECRKSCIWYVTKDDVTGIFTSYILSEEYNKTVIDWDLGNV